MYDRRKLAPPCVTMRDGQTVIYFFCFAGDGDRDEVSSAGSRSRMSSRTCSFCSCIWCTPDMMTFQGQLSGMCFIIRLIMVPASREKPSHHSAGKRRRPTIAPPTTIGINTKAFFIAPPYLRAILGRTPTQVNARPTPKNPSAAGGPGSGGRSGGCQFCPAEATRRRTSSNQLKTKLSWVVAAVCSPG